MTVAATPIAEPEISLPIETVETTLCANCKKPIYRRNRSSQWWHMISGRAVCPS